MGVMINFPLQFDDDGIAFKLTAIFGIVSINILKRFKEITSRQYGVFFNPSIYLRSYWNHYINNSFNYDLYLFILVPTFVAACYTKKTIACHPGERKWKGCDQGKCSEVLQRRNESFSFLKKGVWVRWMENCWQNKDFGWKIFFSFR